MSNFPNKLVVVLNEKIETWRAMNALSHAMLGFGAGVAPKDELHLNEYVDADGNVHKPITEMPIVVLKASCEKIRELRKFAIANNIRYNDFVEFMSAGEYEEEYKLMKAKKDEEIDYWAIILFGPKDKIKEATGKLQLYK